MDGPKRPARPASDPRIAALVTDIGALSSRVLRMEEKLSDVHTLLITEPEASPLGRSLLSRAITNSGRIDGLKKDLEEHEREARQHHDKEIREIEDEHDKRRLANDARFRALEDWRTEWRGVWRFLVGFGTVISIISLFLALGSRFGW